MSNAYIFGVYIGILQASTVRGQKPRESNMMREFLNKQTCLVFLYYTTNIWARAETNCQYMDLCKLIKSLICFRRVKKVTEFQRALSLWPSQGQCLCSDERNNKHPVAFQCDFVSVKGKTRLNFLALKMKFYSEHLTCHKTVKNLSLTEWEESFAWFHKVERLEVGFSLSGSRVKFAPNWRVQMLIADWLKTLFNFFCTFSVQDWNPYISDKQDCQRKSDWNLHFLNPKWKSFILSIRSHLDYKGSWNAIRHI